MSHEIIIARIRENINRIEDKYATSESLTEAEIHYMRQQISTSEAVIFALENDRIARSDAELEELKNA